MTCQPLIWKIRIPAKEAMRGYRRLPLPLDIKSKSKMDSRVRGNDGSHREATTCAAGRDAPARARAGSRLSPEQRQTGEATASHLPMRKKRGLPEEASRSPVTDGDQCMLRRAAETGPTGLAGADVDCAEQSSVMSSIIAPRRAVPVFA